MTNITHILGKDAALEDSIERMQAKLRDIGFEIEEHSWLNPVPNVWSVHIRDKSCHLLFTNGKGASKKAALASALGEFFERLSCNYFFADFYLGQKISNDEFAHYPNERWFEITDDVRCPKGLLDDDGLRQYYNPGEGINSASLVDLNTGNAERGVCAVPYTRQRDGEVIYFPVNIIGNLYVSNGMSAGNTVNEARVQALSEIFERNIKFRIIAEEMALPDIPQSVIDRFEKIKAGIEELEAAGFKILCKDASLGGRYPVISVTLLNPDNHGCYASFGAHPSFEVAFERALTELLQGRSLNALGEFPEPGFDSEEIAHPHNIETHFIDSSGVISWNYLSSEADYDFVDWDFTGTTEEEFKYCCDLIHEGGKDIYISDYEHLGVYGCRIVVPDMSEIYPPDDLEWDNNNTGVMYREAILNLPDLDQAEWVDLLEQIEEDGLDNQQPVAALIGLAPDSGSMWASLRIGELKLLLALATNNTESIFENCEWIRHFGQLDSQRLETYRAIEVRLQLYPLENYEDTLKGLFSAEALEMSRKLLEGESYFYGLSAPTLDLNGCELHQRLLQAYDKLQVQKAKSAN